MLDITFKNNLAPQKGRVLISEPFANDDFFQRSVVFLCEHSKEGSFGFILTNLIKTNLQLLHEDFPEIDVQLSSGGPLETSNLFFIHTLGKVLNESFAVSDAISVGGDFVQLHSFIEKQHIDLHQVRFFIGYSGWGPGQLEKEIKENAWIVAEVDNIDEIMQPNSNLWAELMSKQGKKYEFLSNLPNDPSKN
jgi:putative transcriptional regulator